MEPQFEGAKPKMTPKDFFLYLGTAVTLYFSAGSLLALLFGIINVSVFDALQSAPYYYTGATNAIRFAISALIIVFPLYLLLTWFIRKDIARDTNKYNLSIRKWFIWFTLFIAGAVVAGDVIALVNTYLGGEVTARFVWKILAVAVVAGGVFGYYIYDLRRAGSGDTKVNKKLAVIVALVVLASIVGGFVVGGSPNDLRAQRFDERRVSDLQTLQWQVLNYWQDTGSLPENLDALNDPLEGYSVPSDPLTSEQYGYQILTPLSFKLCATFQKESVDYNQPFAKQAVMDLSFDSSDFFRHGEGEACFERFIDPELHKPVLR